MSRLSLSGRSWQALTRLIKQRDDYACVVCGDTEDTTIDHVIPLSKMTRDQWNDGLPWDPGNLVTMCRLHNSTKGNKESIRQSWVNPQLQAMIPRTSMPGFLVSIGTVPLSSHSYDYGSGNSENASIAREVV